MSPAAAPGSQAIGQLPANELRARFRSASGDTIDDPYPENFLAGGPRQAAVLIPFLWMDGEWHVLFIRRTHVEGDIHSGQVAFPGGGAEPGDESPIATALREAQEEIYLRETDLEVIGTLSRLRTISNYVITPVVGILRWPAELLPNPVEVSRIFTIPLAWLVDPRHRIVQRRELPEPFGAIDVIYFDEYHGELLWGASARIMEQIIEGLQVEP